MITSRDRLFYSPADRLAPLSLLFMAVLWGSTFFVLHDMLDRIDAADLLAVRFTIAAVVFGAVVHRKLLWSRTTVRQGAILGLIAYGTYDLTNLAVMKGFTTRIAIIDMIWGTVLTGAVSGITAAIGVRLLGK